MLYDICPSVLCSCPMILESGDGIRILYSYNMYPFFFLYLILHTLNSGEGEASLRCVSCVAWSFSSSVYEYAMYDMDRLQLCLMVTQRHGLSLGVIRLVFGGIKVMISYDFYLDLSFFVFFILLFLRDGVELIE